LADLIAILVGLSAQQAQNAYLFVRKPRVSIIQKEATKIGLLAQKTLSPFRFKLRDWMLGFTSSTAALSKLEHRMLGYDKKLLKMLANAPAKQ
jgi:hypothetical protein